MPAANVKDCAFDEGCAKPERVLEHERGEESAARRRKRAVRLAETIAGKILWPN